VAGILTHHNRLRGYAIAESIAIRAAIAGLGIESGYCVEKRSGAPSLLREQEYDILPAVIV
jgi:hypothetical protein